MPYEVGREQTLDTNAKCSWRSRKIAVYSLLLSALGFGFFGCGGGSHSSGSTGSSSRDRIIASTRVSRAILAVAGLGRTITRAATPPIQKRWSFGSRIPIMFTSALSATSSSRNSTAPVTTPMPVLDPGTGLYYTTTIQPDGSGQQLLFLDSALTKPAGSFTWQKPEWRIPGTAPTFPGIIIVKYSITAGSYAGVSGQMKVTVNDSNFQNGIIELALTDSKRESAKSTLKLSQEGISSHSDIDLGNGDTCSADATTSDSGTYDQVITFPDGGTADISTNPDGSSTETYNNPESAIATPDLSGTVLPDGSDTIDYSNGTTETVNVDPGDEQQR